MPKKVILYIDMNSFFVSCHEIINPQLKNKPVVVASSSRRAIVSSASYTARKYQIRSAMPLYQAKQICPQLICLSADFSLYTLYARKIYKLLKTMITNKIEIASTDEYCLDITDVYHKYGTVKNCAIFIQKLILEKIKLPCSIGVSYNKFLAKMASKINKPQGIFIFNENNIAQKLWPLDIKDLYGIGKKTADRLRKHNINTIYDFAHCQDSNLLLGLYGKGYVVLQKKALGINDTDFDFEFIKRKSLSYDFTLEYDTSDILLIHDYILKLALKIHFKTKILLVGGKQVTFAFKNEQRKWISKQMQLETFTNNLDVIYSTALILFEQIWNQKPIRALRINLGKITPLYQATRQLEMLKVNGCSRDFAKQSLQSKLIQDINDKYQQEISMSGANFLNVFNSTKPFKF